VDEMENFLDKLQVPKLNEDQTNDLNNLISTKELERVINSLPTKKKKKKKSPGSDGFSTEFYHTFKEFLIPILWEATCAIAEWR
jgi:hypothetical protein